MISRLENTDLTQKKLSDDDSTLVSALLRWPAENLFPVLDICRILVLSKSPVAFVQSSNLADKFRMIGRLSSVPNLLTASRCFSFCIFLFKNSRFFFVVKYRLNTISLPWLGLQVCGQLVCSQRLQRVAFVQLEHNPGVSVKLCRDQ